MNEILAKQIGAIEAQIELLRVQVAGLRHALTPAPRASLELPPHCDGIAADDCGLRTPEARSDHASLAHPHRWMCKGCQVLSTDGATT